MKNQNAICWAFPFYFWCKSHFVYRFLDLYKWRDFPPFKRIYLNRDFRCYCFQNCVIGYWHQVFGHFKFYLNRCKKSSILKLLFRNRNLFSSLLTNSNSIRNKDFNKMYTFEPTCCHCAHFILIFFFSISGNIIVV